MTPPGNPPVLIVEDNEATREALSLLLEVEGYGVATAADGRQALDKLHAGLRPGLILLDLMMPVMDGWQFRCEQRRDRDLTDIPVIVCSAAGDLDERANALGVAACLSKPVDVAELLDAIRHQFSAGKSRRTDPH
jgi:CheY-like chemotaxis protein